MPNPQFTKPWHGVPRDQIQWNPNIIEEACIGCGTGFAPALALIEQQVRFDAAREMSLLWGMRQSQDFYALDTVKELLAEAPNLRVVLVAENGTAVPVTTDRLESLTGTVLDALRSDPHLIGHRDIYAAGPPAMLRDLARSLHDMGVEPSRIHIDSFGV